MANILVNNGNLGRMGKTTIAYTLYKHMGEGTKYVTNDLENASIDLTEFVSASDLLHVPESEDISVDDPSDSHIFDFGGKPDQRLLGVAQFVDHIVIPIAYQSLAELRNTMMNINTLSEKNNNITIVVNNTDAGDLKLVKQAIKANVSSKFKVLELNHSKYIRRLANEGQTVFEVAAASKSDSTRLNRKVIPQFQKLFDTLGV